MQKEIERLIFEDPDPDKGFMLHIDLKWVSMLPSTPALFTSTDACVANGECQKGRPYTEVTVVLPCVACSQLRLRIACQKVKHCAYLQDQQQVDALYCIAIVHR